MTSCGIGLSSTYLYSGVTSDTLKTIHNDVGRDLIIIRHEFPILQGRVYTILDQIGKLYKLSMQTVQKRKQVKLLALQEEQTVRSLKEENHRLTKSLVRLEKSQKEQEFAFSTAQKRVNELEQERSAILKRTEEIEGATKEQQERLEMLEGALADNKSAKSTPQPINTASQATKTMIAKAPTPAIIATPADTKNA